MGAVRTHKVRRRQGQKTFTDTYRCAQHVPLREGDGALLVNWIAIITTDAHGKTLYQNAGITRHEINGGPSHRLPRRPVPAG